MEHRGQYLEDGVLLLFAKAKYVYGGDQRLKIFSVVFVLDFTVATLGNLKFLVVI